jgi:acyl CoA:acetate/3-ketoacid CoA transferase beta subunit
MTGIGFANLAAWVAHRALAGHPFIFSHRNLPTCTWMTGVTEILGAVLAGDHGGALAVLGAGTVDRNGNMNSSRSASGRFLVGSGGAADIASGAC